MNKFLLILLTTTLFLVSCKGEDVLIPVQLSKDGDYGYMNLDGIMVIPPQFKDAYAFKDGFAIVRISDKFSKSYTFIDKNGNRMFGVFDYATAFHEGIACVQIDKNTKYINTKGNVIFETEGWFLDYFSEGLAGVMIDDKWGFINNKGEIVIQPQFDEVVAFADGMACVEVGNRWGFVDNRGKIVIEPKFEKPTWFRDGYAQLQDTELYIDKQGNYVQVQEVHLNRNDFEGLILENGKFRDKDGKLYLYEDDENFEFPLPGKNSNDDVCENAELYYTGGYVSFYIGWEEGVLSKIDHKNHCIKKVDVGCSRYCCIQFHNDIAVSYKLVDSVYRENYVRFGGGDWEVHPYTEYIYKQGIIDKNLNVVLDPIYENINLKYEKSNAIPKYDYWDDYWK